MFFRTAMNVLKALKKLKQKCEAWVAMIKLKKI